MPSRPTIKMASHSIFVPGYNLSEAPFLDRVHGINEFTLLNISPAHIPEFFKDLFFVLKLQISIPYLLNMRGRDSLWLLLDHLGVIFLWLSCLGLRGY